MLRGKLLAFYNIILILKNILILQSELLHFIISIIIKLYYSIILILYVCYVRYHI